MCRINTILINKVCLSCKACFNLYSYLGAVRSSHFLCLLNNWWKPTVIIALFPQSHWNSTKCYVTFAKLLTNVMLFTFHAGNNFGPREAGKKEWAIQLICLEMPRLFWDHLLHEEPWALSHWNQGASVAAVPGQSQFITTKEAVQNLSPNFSSKEGNKWDNNAGQMCLWLMLTVLQWLIFFLFLEASWLSSTPSASETTFLSIQEQSCLLCISQSSAQNQLAWVKMQDLLFICCPLPKFLSVDAKM